MKTFFHRRSCESLLFAFTFYLCLNPILDPDLWWHLTTGRWLTSNGFIGRIPTFSFTSTESSWSSGTWLYDCAIYLVSGSAHALGRVTLLHAFLFGAAAVLIWRTIEASTPRDELRGKARGAALLFCALAILLADSRFRTRPEAVSYLVCAALQYCLVAVWRAGSRRRFGHLLALPLLQLVWANTHGVFVLGPVMMGVAWLSLRIRKIQVPGFNLAFALSCLSCFATPRGLDSLLYPIHLVGVLHSKVFQNNIVEAQSPRDLGFFSQRTLLFSSWCFCLAFAFFVAGPRKIMERFSALPVVLVPLLAYFAFSAQRNVPFFVFLTIPLVVSGLAAGAGERARQRAVALVVLALLALPTGVRLAGVQEPFSVSLEPPSWQRIDRALLYLGGVEFRGRIFTDAATSDYLLVYWPHYSSYIDTRFAELQKPEHFERYLKLIENPMLIEEELARYGIEAVIVAANENITFGIASQLARLGSWHVAYYDEAAIVFLKSPAGARQAWGELALNRILKNEPDPRIASKSLVALARLSRLVQRFKVAEAALGFATSKTPDSFAAWHALCEFRVVDAKNSAEKPCRRAIELDPRAFNPYALLTSYFVMKGELTAATELVREQLRRGFVVSPILRRQLGL